ncbi:protein kinase domain-containing protein [Planctomycetaceae bacterium SH139]
MERELFMRALEISDPVQRRAFLNSESGDDPELANRVLELFHQHERESALVIDRPLFGDSEVVDYPRETREAGVQFGPYELIRRLGAGGMGEVWLASQTEPVKREIALKLIRTGRETTDVLQRFEAERQALAVLDHPNIARVIDAGATPSGLPFFVMELVQGLPLVEYCNQARLTIRKRLEVFTQIANAVSHAHQKAILHRDIKPSNVLITEVDGRAVPKVIDFGLAKALSGSLTPDPLATRAGDIVGTLEYMAPEQAGYRGHDVDTRADVYSLGVLLYELLTGLRPFDSKKLQEAALDEALRIVKEEEPVIPSLRLSSSGTAESSATLRQTEPSRLRSLLKNELDWIVMKALEKDRSRRYQSAGEFADDVNRYLQGEPVEAHPPSRSYRIRKFVAKNRGLATSIAAVTVALIVGIVGVSYGLLQANAATRTAEQEKADADAARNEAINAKREETRQKQFALGISDFLKSDFLRLTSVTSQTHSSELRDIAADEGIVPFDATLGDLVDRAAEKLSNRQDLDPLVDAEISWILGASYKNNGDDDSAIPLLERAVQGFRNAMGVASENYQGARRSLITSLLLSGKLDEAELLIMEALSQPLTADAHSARFAALATREMANLHAVRGDGKSAIEMAEKSLKLSMQVEGYPGDIIMGKFTLGKHLFDLKDADRGIPLLKEAVDALAENYGDDFPTTLDATLYYASALRKIGSTEAAISCYERVLPLTKKTLGPTNETTLTTLSNLATAYNDAKRSDEAIELGREAMEITEAAHGEEDVRTIQRMVSLGMIYAMNRRNNEAIPLLERAADLSIKLRGLHDPNTLVYMDRLAKVYLFSGNVPKAGEVFEKILACQVETLHPSSQATLATMLRLAEVCEKLSSHGRAVELLKRRYELVQAEFGEESPGTQLYKSTYLAAVGTKLIAEGDFAQAASTLLSAYEIRNSVAPDDWNTHTIQSKLGEAQLGLKEYDEASKSLEAAVQAMLATKRPHPDRSYFLNNAIDRLLSLAESTDDAASLRKWQAQKDTLSER